MTKKIKDLVKIVAVFLAIVATVGMLGSLFSRNDGEDVETFFDNSPITDETESTAISNESTESSTKAAESSTEAPEETTEASDPDFFAIDPAPGLYESGSNYSTLVMSWDDLVANGAVVVSNGVATPGDNIPAGDLAFPNDGSVTTLSMDSVQNKRWNTLTGIFISDAITSIRDSAFEGCVNLNHAVIGGGIATFGTRAFSLCSTLQRVYLSAGVKSIPFECFSSCSSLAQIHTESLAAFCKIGCSNQGHLFVNNFTSLYVDGQPITDLVIPDSLTEIGNYLFSGCDTIESISIGDNLSSCGAYTFASCSALETVKMSSGSFGLGTFDSCSAIKVFDLSGCTSVLTIFSEYYPPCTGTSTIYVPADLYDEWIAAEYWCDIADRIVAVEDGQVPAYLNELN